ncbi:hypothetical protein N0V90_009555 [Kalmusia sp. IMI 367209]|nr:hypothetical protein N0V90_009555 [Kalmusia sp. IMI 367209]
MSDDLPPREPDALSLHTIAEEADAYAAQEQADADSALALALEDGETFTESFAPYHDDPEADDEADLNFEPYRDEPGVSTADDIEEVEEAQESVPARRRWLDGCVQWLGRCGEAYSNVGRAWLAIACILVVLGMISAITTITVLVVRKKSARDSAWDLSGSRDYDIKINKLYPPLEQGASEKCKRLWEENGNDLRCHRMILSSVWDKGISEDIESEHANPYGYVEEICQPTCRKSIQQMDIPIHKGCFKRSDRFDLTNYGKDGKPYFTKNSVEEGPIAVYQSLIARYDRFCAPAKTNYEFVESEWGTCAADLWMRWGIVDGIEEAHMQGVANFLEATKEIRTVPAHEQSGEVELRNGTKKSYKVKIPTRPFGPKSFRNQTDCGYCMTSWLERKFLSYEYGQMLDPGNVVRTMMKEQHPTEWDPDIDEGSGDALSLDEFSEIRRLTVRRCKEWGAGQILMTTHRKWKKFGWWCKDPVLLSGRPCQPQPNITTVMRQVLHGINLGDSPLPELRQYMQSNNSGFPHKVAYRALHDGMADMPCSLWFNQEDAIQGIIPHAYTVQHLCSDKCRNAIDRIQDRNNETLAAASNDHFVQAWNRGRELVEKICRTKYSNLHINEQSIMCAPGYAALGRPEWTFESGPIAKQLILSAFSNAIDRLDKSLELYPDPPKNDEDRRILNKRTNEGVCNACAAALFIGRNPNWKGRVDEFIDSGEIDGEQYVKVGKKFFLTCFRMAGVFPNQRDQKEFWRSTGLDRFD